LKAEQQAELLVLSKASFNNVVKALYGEIRFESYEKIVE